MGAIWPSNQRTLRPKPSSSSSSSEICNRNSNARTCRYVRHFVVTCFLAIDKCTCYHIPHELFNSIDTPSLFDSEAAPLTTSNPSHCLWTFAVELRLKRTLIVGNLGYSEYLGSCEMINVRRRWVLAIAGQFRHNDAVNMCIIFTRGLSWRPVPHDRFPTQSLNCAILDNPPCLSYDLYWSADILHPATFDPPITKNPSSYSLVILVVLYLDNSQMLSNLKSTANLKCRPKMSSKNCSVSCRYT